MVIKISIPSEVITNATNHIEINGNITFFPSKGLVIKIKNVLNLLKENEITVKLNNASDLMTN